MKTEFTDSPHRYWVVDVTSTQCICLEFLGGGDSVRARSEIRCLKLYHHELLDKITFGIAQGIYKKSSSGIVAMYYKEWD